MKFEDLSLDNQLLDVDLDHAQKVSKILINHYYKEQAKEDADKVNFEKIQDHILGRCPRISDIRIDFNEALWPPDKPHLYKRYLRVNLKYSHTVITCSFGLYIDGGPSQTPIQSFVEEKMP